MQLVTQPVQGLLMCMAVLARHTEQQLPYGVTRIHITLPERSPALLAAMAVLLFVQLVSTVLTIALLGGAAWFYFQYSGSDNSSSGGSSGSGSGKTPADADLDDPLAEARRIMDKYKK